MLITTVKGILVKSMLNFKINFQDKTTKRFVKSGS